MGFELIRIKNKTAPMIICDNCKKPILRANEGLMVWERRDNLEETILFKIVHKGKCDTDKSGLSMELRHYFAHLDANCIRETKEDDQETAEFQEEF
jgi:hypothetical protein